MKDSKHILFRSRNLQKVWVAQILSQAGSRLYQLAIIWWIVSQNQEKQSLLLAGFLVCASLPSIIFNKWIGPLIDRSSSKKILIGVDVLATFTVAGVLGLTLLGLLEIYHLYIAGFLLSSLQATFDPCLNRSVSQIVDDKDIPETVGLVGSTIHIANFVGAGAGAFLIDLLGLDGAMIVNLLSYAIAAVLTQWAVFKEKETKKNTDSKMGSWAVLSMFPDIKPILFSFAGINFFITPILVILPLYVKKVLAQSAFYLGALEAALTAGLVLGSFIGPKFVPQIPATRFARFGIPGLGAALLFPGLIHNEILLGFALTAFGFLLGINNVLFMTHFQRKVPDEFKGRFFAVLMALILAAVPMGYFVFGALGEFISIPNLFLVQAVGLAFMSSPFWLRKESKSLSIVEVTECSN